MMSLAIRTHALQMWTFGPATSFSTSFSLFPQKEQCRLRIGHLDATILDLTRQDVKLGLGGVIKRSPAM